MLVPNVASPPPFFFNSQTPPPSPFRRSLVSSAKTISLKTLVLENSHPANDARMGALRIDAIKAPSSFHGDKRSNQESESIGFESMFRSEAREVFRRINFLNRSNKV